MIGHYPAGARPGFISSILGAIAVLWGYRLFLRLTHRDTHTTGPARKTV
jgi:hypothetical protein